MIQFLPLIFGAIKIISSFFSSEKLKNENLKQALFNEAKKITKKKLNDFVVSDSKNFSESAKIIIQNIMSQLNKTEQIKFAKKINENEFMLKNFNVDVENNVVKLAYKGFHINFSISYDFDKSEIKAGIYAGQ